MRWTVIFISAALTGCSLFQKKAPPCEINYKGCCLVETKTELKLFGKDCWPPGEFLFNAGEITHLIDMGKQQALNASEYLKHHK